MEQAVLRALMNAMQGQSEMQLAAMQSQTKVEGAATLVNNDLSKQVNTIKSDTNTTGKINVAQTVFSIVFSIAAVAAISASGGAAIGLDGAAVTSFESLAGVMQGTSGMAESGLYMANKIVQKKTQDATAQADLDGVTTTILGSVMNTIANMIQDGASSNAMIGQDTSAAIQAYGRAQQEQ